jgi:hypothetical protein
MSFSAYGKKVKYLKQREGYIICASCKNKIAEWTLKQTVVPVGQGYKVRGDCPVCKHFAKWLPNNYSGYYGKI